MENEIMSAQESHRVTEKCHDCDDEQETQDRLGTSRHQPVESPLPHIETNIGVPLVSMTHDSNRKKESSLSPRRQKKTQKRKENKTASKAETNVCDIPRKRQGHKASSTRSPISPVSSSTTTTCMATLSPNTVASITTISALSTMANHSVTQMDELPRGKEKKLKDGKRKRTNKVKLSQRTLQAGPSVDGAMTNVHEVSLSNNSDVNNAKIQLGNDAIETSTLNAPQGNPTISTKSRVHAAKKVLNVSQQELPGDNHRTTSDKVREQKRATKKRLANLSLQRESLHNAKPSSRRSSCSKKKPTHRKKTQESGPSNIQQTQNSMQDNLDGGQQHKGTISKPYPHQLETSFVASTETATMEVSRHERRLAARNELEAISTHIRHRSHSRSLRTRESSTRRQVDMGTSSLHAASSDAQSSSLEEDITSTIMMTTSQSSNDRDPASKPAHGLSNFVGSSSPSEQPLCLAPKSKPTQLTEHRKQGLLVSKEESDEVNSFACSLDSSMSQNTPTELVLESIQDDALQIIRMLPPKLASKSQWEQKTPSPEIPISTCLLSTHSSIACKGGPIDSSSKPDLLTGHCEGPSSGRHPKTDLQSFLKHIAVLNDLKALTDLSLAGDSAEFVHSELMDGTGSPTKFRRFQRLFQLKCTLFNILRQESPDDAHRLRQTLLQHYDVDQMDLDFVLEHLALCEQENINIRWDLVRMIFFPDDEDPSNYTHEPESRVGHHSMPMLSHPSNLMVTSEDKRFWHSNVEFPTWNSLSDSVYMEKSHASTDNCHIDEEAVEEQQPCWSPMEEFQEEILELFESVESSMLNLPFEESRERRLVLVQLLQATNEEESHMTTLNFDDMAEIVRHIRICRKTQTDVQWDMIRDIVFPFGLDSLNSQRRADGDGSRDWGQASSMENSCVLQQSCRSADLFELSDHTIDISGQLSDMTREDLDVVLQHIQVALGNDIPIRWDLIGDILFPGDPDRQSIFSDGIMTK